MSIFESIKKFLKKITKSIYTFWKSEKVSKLRDDFKDFVMTFGEEAFNEVLKPFIIEQVKKYAIALMSGDVKFAEVKNLYLNRMNEIRNKMQTDAIGISPAEKEELRLLERDFQGIFSPTREETIEQVRQIPTGLLDASADAAEPLVRNLFIFGFGTWGSNIKRVAK